MRLKIPKNTKKNHYTLVYTCDLANQTLTHLDCQLMF